MEKGLKYQLQLSLHSPGVYHGLVELKVKASSILMVKSKTLGMDLLGVAVLLKVRLIPFFGSPSTWSSYCPLSLSNHVGFLYEARIKKVK